jgi:hypothetical protein
MMQVSPVKSLLMSKVRDREDMASPDEHDSKKANVTTDTKEVEHVQNVNDKGTHSGDQDLKTMMMNSLEEQRTVSGKRDQQHQELLGAFKDLKQTVAKLDVSINTEKETREKEIAEINSRLDTMQSVKETRTSTSKFNDDQDENWRDFQVIAGGFDEDTGSSVIEETINEFLKLVDLTKKAKKVFTFSEQAQVGIIEFETIAAKISFYKKIKDMDKSIMEGKELWFNDNRTFERRARDKALGQLKHMLITKAGHKVEDVKIKWKFGKVEIKHKKVATVHDGGDFELAGEAENVKEHVVGAMRAWFVKKGADAPYSQ